MHGTDCRPAPGAKISYHSETGEGWQWRVKVTLQEVDRIKSNQASELVNRVAIVWRINGRDTLDVDFEDGVSNEGLGLDMEFEDQKKE